MSLNFINYFDLFTNKLRFYKVKNILLKEKYSYLSIIKYLNQWYTCAELILDIKYTQKFRHQEWLR